MIRPPTIIAVIAISLCFLVSGCSSGQQSTAGPPSFDTSYTAPIHWKLVEEGLWGLRFSIPRTLQPKESANSSLWIHEGPNLRFIVDFGSTSLDSLKKQPHYLETRLQVNGLSAVVCSYDRTNPAAGSLKKVVALFFLEKRKELGGQEPSYRVEYASDDERATALQILQTVRFYDS